MSEIVRVNLGHRSYDIVIARDALRDVGARVTQAISGARRCVIVSNNTVWPLYGDVVTQSLRQVGITSEPILIDDGETHKTWGTLEHIVTRMLELRVDRKTVLVALGGGVVGDIGGFAAAIYQRGIPFVQIPTTLLSQVDSSVGGKTAVNHPLGKNMIGAFYQPRLVVIDPTTLRTLPPREFSAGLAEVLKYGLIADASFAKWLGDRAKALRAMASEDDLIYAIAASCAHKARIVEADETETGIRAYLNFGHTFGHAVEAGLGYGTWLHGEAVGAGMVAATQLSRDLGDLDQSSVDQVSAWVAAIGCPTQLPPLGAERYWQLMQLDKKVDHQRVNFITLKKIGEAHIARDVSFERVRTLLA